MKNLLIQALILFSVSGISSCFAQDTTFEKKRVHAKTESYDVSEITPHYKDVQNVKRHTYKGTGVTHPPKIELIPQRKDIQYDKTRVAQIMFDVFPQSRLKKLANEGLDLQINYIVDMEGNVMDISFVFRDDSSLTPVEIEKLEHALTNDLKFTLNTKVFEGNTHLPLHNSVNFQRLINHLPNAVYP